MLLPADDPHLNGIATMTNNSLRRTPRAKKTGVPPGPPGSPLVGNLRDMRVDAARGWVRARERYGEVVHYQIAGRQIYLLCHPDDVRYVLVDNARNYTKGRGLAKAKPLLGEGLLTSEGEFWLRQRRLAQPAFHRQRIAGLGTIMTDETQKLLHRWDAISRYGSAFDVAEDMMQLTLSIVSRAMFNTALTADDIATVSEAFPPLLRWARERVTAVFDFTEHLPTPQNRQRVRYGRQLDGIAYRIIRERRSAGAQHYDLLSMLMEARDEETGTGMTDRQIRDEIMTIFIAGHETTALLLSWTWAMLSRHPDVRQHVEAEIDEVLGGRVPTAADVQRLPYLGRVINEVLRLHPPVWAVLRSPIADDRVSHYTLRAGSTVIVSPYVTHRHPSFWPNPEGFDPDRFQPEASRSRHCYAFFPFGGGQRLCIGNNFAQMEATLITAMVCQRYQVNLVSGHPIEPELGFTMRIRGGLPVRLVRREVAAHSGLPAGC